MRKLTRTELIALAAIALALICAATLFFGNDALIERLVFAGTLASILSLILVLVQLTAVKESASTATTTAIETRDRLFAFLAAVDIAKSLKTIQEIQIYNRAGKFELSIIRMQELRSSLTDMLSNERLKIYLNQKTILRHISDLSVNLTSLEKEVYAPSESFDIVGLNQFLNSVSTALDIIYSKTKHQGTGL